MTRPAPMPRAPRHPGAYRIGPGPLRCGLHGDETTTGRCPTCDATGDTVTTDTRTRIRFTDPTTGAPCCESWIVHRNEAEAAAQLADLERHGSAFWSGATLGPDGELPSCRECPIHRAGGELRPDSGKVDHPLHLGLVRLPFGPPSGLTRK